MNNICNFSAHRLMSLSENKRISSVDVRKNHASFSCGIAEGSMNIFPTFRILARTTLVRYFWLNGTLSTLIRCCGSCCNFTVDIRGNGFFFLCYLLGYDIPLSRCTFFEVCFFIINHFCHTVNGRAVQITQVKL